ncbi:MAG: hypothetical protein LBV79_10095 [Candidatus Adiutrix sp.]|nr:hypothetical protein [Candidatus Adiutrix sp.]
MKKVLVLLSALALLTGCVSGGGGSGGSAGGGGGSAPPSDAIVWEPHPAPGGAGQGAPLTVAGDVFSVGSASMSVPVAAGAASIAQIDKTADGLKINYLSEREIAFSVAAGDFKDNDNLGDYIMAVKDSTGRYATTPNIIYKARDAVYLGGKRLGLQHSDFGLWATNEYTRYDYQSSDEGGVLQGGTGFAMGDASKAASFSGTGTQNFTGNTIAQVFGGGSDMVHHVTGTATMAVNLADLGNSNLAISLNHSMYNPFAAFTIPVAIDSNGAISATGNAVLTSQGTTYKDLGGNFNADVDGQFYGTSPNVPTEAAGSYFLQNDVSTPTTITGSFGLKKQ